MFNKTFNNMRERLVKCYICKIEFKTREPHPKCPQCKWDMITVLVSPLGFSLEQEERKKK